MTRRRLFYIALYIAMPMAALLLFGASQQHQGRRLCTGVQVQLEQTPDNLFLDQQQLRALMQADDRLMGSPLGQLSLSQIEARLHATRYVAEAHAQVLADASVQVQVRLRQPIARVVNENGQGFYVDANGNKLPLAEGYAARMALVRGRFEEQLAKSDTLQDSTLRSLMPLLRFVYNDEFYRAQVAEVVVQPGGDVLLLPEVGSVVVNLGSATDHARKLAHLYTFYQDVLSKKGWDYYSSVSLKYVNQLVATRRDGVADVAKPAAKPPTPKPPTPKPDKAPRAKPRPR